VTTLSNPTRTLAEVAADPAAALAAVTIPGDPALDAVVLARADAGTVDVFAGGSIHPYPDTTPVTDITDDDRRLRLLGDTLTGLDQQRRRLAAQTLGERDQYAATLADIRGYAIDRYHQDFYGLDQLNEFLRTVELAEYHPRVRVSYTISGSYEVRGGDTGAAHRDTRWLRVDHSSISYLLEGTPSHTVEVDTVELLDR
jgi:hypothetical protein